MFSSKVLAAALTALIATTAHAQSTTTTTTMPTPVREHSLGLSIEPHWLIIGGIGGKVDFRVADNIALGLGGMYISPRSTNTSSSSTTDTDYRWSMYEVYLGPTINLSGNYDTSGAFITPAIGYTGAKITNYGYRGLSGSLNTPELRLTGGYQWVIRDLRFSVGGGLKLLKDSEVVVKNTSGGEESRQRSSTTGGFALDCHAAWLF